MCPVSILTFQSLKIRCLHSGAWVTQFLFFKVFTTFPLYTIICKRNNRKGLKHQNCKTGNNYLCNGPEGV